MPLNQNKRLKVTVFICSRLYEQNLNPLLEKLLTKRLHVSFVPCSSSVLVPNVYFLLFPMKSFLQFNDALLYTTPVQSGMYKLNNMLSLAGMKVCAYVFFSFLPNMFREKTLRELFSHILCFSMLLLLYAIVHAFVYSCDYLVTHLLIYS